MTYKVQEIFRWFEHFEGKGILISGDTKEFYIELSKTYLPHLLGLHYMNTQRNSLKGGILYNYVKKNNFSDDEIFDRIRKSKNSINMNSVKTRINSFQMFMENIDHACIVENTKKDSKIKSDHFIIRTEDNRIQHLGILDTGGFNEVVSFDIVSLETYFNRGDDRYYQNSSIMESVRKVLFFENEKQCWRAGSFNLEKDAILKNIPLSMQEEQYEKLLEEVDQEMESFEYEGFHFIGFRPFMKEEQEYDLYEISDFLEHDGMADLKNYSCENFLKNDELNDLFFNLETRNVYVPGNHQLFKWKISPEEVAVCLQTRLDEMNLMKMDEVAQEHKVSL
ncbi:PBECR4 domain-containing protein [Bulleidia extructa]